MATDADLLFSSASELRKLIGDKELSPVELVEASLRRIERFNPALRAFLTTCGENALADAQRAEQAVMDHRPLGRLHGIPVSIKDLEATAGTRTTRGSLIYKDDVPKRNQLVVERLKAAGAIVVGKTNTPEFGRFGLTENRLGPPCVNPWNTAMGAGGSSGGAAAGVAAGLTPIAQGSDGGGSIRIPASFTGIYGIKGTQGRVPRRAEGPASWHPINFSCTGPLTRTVKDAALLLEVMAGPHPNAEYGTIEEDPPDYQASLHDGIAGCRVGFSMDFGSAPVHPDVRQRVEQAVMVFTQLGAYVEEAPFVVNVEEAWRRNEAIARVRLFATHRGLLKKHREELTDYVLADLEAGAKISAAEYFELLSGLGQLRAYVSEYFDRFSLLISPTLATPAFEAGSRLTEIAGRQVSPRWGHYPFTFIFNNCGNPAASVPCGFSETGLPIGLQIVGAVGDDELVLRASAAFEAVRPWAEERPPGFA